MLSLSQLAELDAERRQLKRAATLAATTLRAARRKRTKLLEKAKQIKTDDLRMLLAERAAHDGLEADSEPGNDMEVPTNVENNNDTEVRQDEEALNNREHKDLEDIQAHSSSQAHSKTDHDDKNVRAEAEAKTAIPMALPSVSSPTLSSSCSSASSSTSSLAAAV